MIILQKTNDKHQTRDTLLISYSLLLSLVFSTNYLDKKVSIKKYGDSLASHTDY